MRERRGQLAHNEQRRTVLVSANEGGGWSITSLPQGQALIVSRFCDAIRLAERLAAEREAQLSLRTEWVVAGDFGPKHLIGNPAVCRVRDGGGWAVVILNRPWHVADFSREFVGPDAEGSSQRYATRLIGLFAGMARDEQARRARRDELRRREHKARAGQTAEARNG